MSVTSSGACDSIASMRDDGVVEGGAGELYSPILAVVWIGLGSCQVRNETVVGSRVRRMVERLMEGGDDGWRHLRLTDD